MRKNINWTPSSGNIHQPAPLSQLNKPRKLKIPKDQEYLGTNIFPFLEVGNLFVLCKKLYAIREEQFTHPVLVPQKMRGVSDSTSTFSKGTIAIYMGKSRIPISYMRKSVNAVSHTFMIGGSLFSLVDLTVLKSCSSDVRIENTKNE